MPFTCHLRWDMLPDGRDVSTIDLFSIYNQPAYLPGMLPRSIAAREWARNASDLCTSLGRYETAIGGDYSNMYRARTWQQALATHELLVEHPEVHTIYVEAREQVSREIDARQGAPRELDL